MTTRNEAFSRVIIDTQLADQGWHTQDQNSVRYEVVLPDRTRADYVLCDRHGRALAVIEAKRFSLSPEEGAKQAKDYARQLKVPYVFLANGKEIRSIQSQQATASQKAQATFDALLGRAFQGNF
jgi:type I restriction enzyme R subunit